MNFDPQFLHRKYVPRGTFLSLYTKNSAPEEFLTVPSGRCIFYILLKSKPVRLFISCLFLNILRSASERIESTVSLEEGVTA